jgi:hypothetical protein
MLHIRRVVDMRQLHLGAPGRGPPRQTQLGDAQRFRGQRHRRQERRHAAPYGQRHRPLAQPLQVVLLLLQVVVVRDLGPLDDRHRDGAGGLEDAASLQHPLVLRPAQPGHLALQPLQAVQGRPAAAAALLAARAAAFEGGVQLLGGGCCVVGEPAVAGKILAAHHTEDIQAPAGQRVLPAGGQGRQQRYGQAGRQLAQAQAVPTVAGQQFGHYVGGSPYRLAFRHQHGGEVEGGPARLGHRAQVRFQS